MTPMIDVVFQLIIFFVATVDLQDARPSTTDIRLAHGAARPGGRKEGSARR